MFKRIGATILTIVMLLSMASVVSLAAESAKMELDVTLLDENNQQIATVYPGDKINAVVKIKNPVAISGMTVAGIYDGDIFTAGAPVVENPADVATEKVLTGIPSDPVEEKILVAWIAEENVLLADDTVLMTVPLTVKAEATPKETDLSFYFVQDGMYVEFEGNPVALEETQYSAEKVVASIAVSNTPAVETTLEVIAPAAAEVGQEITVLIKVKDYAQNWSALTIVGSYNDNVLELISEKTVKHEFKKSEIVEDSFMDAANGIIAAAWFNENVVDNVGPEFDALTLTFKVEAAGEANLSFSFKEDDIYGENNAPITEGFSKAPVEKEITITEPTAPIVPTSLEVIAPAAAEVGQEITVKIKVKDYAKNWSALTIVGSYNDDVLELISEKTVKHEFKKSEIVEDSFMDAANGTIAAAWFNENVVDNVGPEFDALTLTFKVEAAGEANLSFSFKEDGIYGENNVPITEGFSKAPVEKEITITEPTAPIVPTSLEVEAPADAKEGDTITVKVNVKNYASAWSTMTIKGSYDKNKLFLENVEAVDFKDSASGTDEVIEPLAGALGVTWLNIETVEMDEEFTALTLTFRVLEEGDAKLSFFFEPDGILNGEEKVPTEEFETEAAEATIAIAPADLKTQLVVDVEEESAKVGETVTVKVSVKGYKDNWSTLSIEGKYDPKKFELKKHTEGTFTDGGVAGEPVFVDKNGALGVNWLNDNAVVKGDEFKALTLEFKVLSQGDGKGAFEFTFIPEGVLDADGNVAENTFETSKASDEVTLLPNDTKTTLSVKIDEDTANVGEDIRAHVYVHDYANLWSTMSIIGRYDTAKVRVKEILPKGFCGEKEQAEGVEPVIKNQNGEISVCWPNTGVVEKEATFEALEIVFTALDEGNAEFAFAFMEDGILDANGDKVPVGGYDTNEKTDSVVLEKNQTMLNVLASAERAKVGEQVTYTISLENYKDNWLAMAIATKYDQTKLKFIEATSLIDGFDYYEASSTDGAVNAAWVHNDPVALDQDDVLKITFEVIGEGNTDVSVEFKPKGMIAEDPFTGDVGYAPEESFVKEAVKKPIDLFAASFLEIVGADKVTEAEEYTVDLVLKNYNNNWSSFGAELYYDTTAFVIEDNAKIVAKTFGGVAPVVDTSVAGKIRLDWSNAGNISADKNAIVLSVTFRALSPREDVEFNTKLDGVDAYEYETAEALIVDIKKPKTPHLSVVVENGSAMDEGDDGVLKLYLNEYTSEWSSIPVVLYFDKDLIRINEGAIVCNPLGGVDGEVVLRADDGKVIFTWLALQNIEADDEAIELASIPFRAYKEGVAVFDAEFVADSLLTRNQQGGYDVVSSDTYIADTEEKTVTINDQYPNIDPMFLTIDTANEAIKNKKETLNLILNNFNPRMQALSVKLFYDKDKVTISEEDIQELLGDDTNIVGGYVLNKNEGYIHFTWVSSDGNMANATNPTLATLRYTPKNGEKVSFYAVFDQVIDNELELMTPVFDYAERSENAIVNIKANPSLSATADKTNVKIGDTVTLTVSVNDYLNLWSNMTINGSYDKNLLRLESITLTDAFGNKSYELGDGSFKAIWSNAENVIAGSDFDVITLVFKVIDCGTAKFNFTLEDVLTNGTTPMVPDEDYLVNAESVDEINIEICNHKWSSTITHKEGTFGDASKHTQTCTKGCGAIKEEGCRLTITKTKASCGVNGTITYKCSLCGYNETFDDLNAPALTHKFDGKPVHKAGTKKHVYTCTRGCGATKEENCTAKKQVVEATCLKDGYTIFSCTVCGDSYTGDVVKAAGKHGVLTLHYIAPTATTNGSIITQCDTCKEYVVPPYAGAVKKTLKAGHPFPDVQEPTMWYYDAINFNKAFGIFGGDELGNFNPTANITRGQLVTVLGRIMMAEAEKTMSAAEFNKFLNAQTSKVSGMKSTSGFTDLGGKYYERYAKLFAKWGIVNGYPDGTFGGDKNITREEMATLIKRFVEAYGADVNTIKFGNAATFSDFAKVSGWAKGNVEWVGKVGLFQGDTNKSYNPQSNATRAEIAVVIYRMLPVLKNICVCSLNH